MRAYILPQRRAAEADDAIQLMNTLWDEHRIWVASSAYQGKLLVRFSAQIYAERADYLRTVEVLNRVGWPGRA